MLTPAEIGAARSVIIDHIKNSGCTLAYSIKLLNRQLSTGNLPPHLEVAMAKAWQKRRTGILTVKTFENWLRDFKERGNFEPLVRQKDFTVKPWHELAYHLKQRNPGSKATAIIKKLNKKYSDVSIHQLRKFYAFMKEEGGKA